MRSKWDITPERGTRSLRRVGAVATAIGVAVCTLALVAGGGSAPTSVDVTVPSTAAGAPVAAGVAGAPALLPAEAAVARVPIGAPTQTASAPASASSFGPRAAAPSGNEGDPPTPPGQEPRADDIPGQWVVQLRDGENAGEVAAAHDAEVDHVYDAGFDGFSASMTEEEALQAADDPRVASIVRDRRVYATDLPTGIPRSHAVGMETAVGSGGAVDVDVAVVDTGIDLTHSDLETREGVNCQGSGKPTDGNGHGTHVAGTIGAKANGGNGIVGVAPGARVWAVKVLDSSGSGSWSDVACGLNWVAQHAGTIEVANLSLGGSGSDGSCGSSALHQASCAAVNAGVTVVVAAGNSGANASKHVPAAFDEVITVSALADFDGRPGGAGNDTCRSDEDDTLANFSNYGPDVDLIAPGVCILSTWKGGGTKTISGTSMASPHVAGAAAAYLAGHPGTSPANVKSVLQANGNDGWSGDRGDGGKEPLLDLSFLGGTGLPAPTSTISAAGRPGTYDDGTKSKVKVTWSGVFGSNVDIRRDDGAGLALIKTTANDGAWTDKFPTKLTSGTTRTYQVCAAGSTTTCSDPFTVTF